MAQSRVRRVSGTVGAVLGVVVFVLVGLRSAILYGGWTGLVIAGAFFGHPVKMHLGAKILVGCGSVLGALALGALFTVAGSVAGSLTGGAIEVFRRGLSQPPPVEAKTDPKDDGAR
jgi:hypothetical protein